MSANKPSETDGAKQSARPRKSPAPESTARKQRSGDLGRALRSVYDDTVRESVPDDLLDLLGKLG